MPSPLPHRPSLEHDPAQTWEIDLADETATHVLEPLATLSARQILEILHDGPATASDIDKQLEVSLQTVLYHLQKLDAAGLITEIGSWYSEKGAEMSVYAVTTERIEFYIGSGEPPHRTLAKGTNSAD